VAILAEALIRWDWIGSHLDDIAALLREHVVLTALPVLFGLVISLPLAVAAAGRPRLSATLLSVTSALYTIPSLAFFVLLMPFTGLSKTTAIIALTVYTLVILARNALTGLQGVPRDVQEAAEAMGYRRGARLLRVELPLALPVIMAGIRIATVTTIGLVTVSAFIGQGGLGRLFLDGFRRDFLTPVVVGFVLSMVLAVAADLLLLAAQRAATPWAREGRS
jgi:osmoprotectant transport system permease protein